MQKIQLIHGNCETEIQKLPDESVDVILTDPPYGIMDGLDLGKKLKGKTRRNGCYSWDRALDLDLMFSEFKRVLKGKGKAIIFSQGKFTTEVRTKSDADLKYLYPLYWKKNHFGCPLSVNIAPLSYVEDISVSSKPAEKGKNGLAKVGFTIPEGKGHVSNLLEFKKDYPSQHPTQKPVALLQYLIEVYTKDGAVILDTTMGSGSTGVACVNTGRGFIGIELSERYFEVAKNRIADAERAKQCETQSLAF